VSRPGAVASLIVRVDEETYAIACADVVTVVPLPTLQPVPSAPRPLLGTFSFRGELVPVIDLARALTSGSVGNRLAARVVIVRTERGLCGALVNRVVDVRRIEAPSRTLDVDRNPVVGDTTLLDGRPVHVLRLENALPPELAGLVGAR
jgi:chemotaxis-related protein WspB